MKILKFARLIVPKFTSAITMIAVIAFTIFGPHLVLASSFTSSKDTSTRLILNSTAEHVIVFTLPSTITFDVSGNTDVLRVDFPASFTLGGVWQTSDFTFNDGTARTVNGVASGAGTIDVTCTDATNNVGVAIDTTAKVFTIKPCGASFGASGSAATVTFTIFGTTTTGTGTLANPSSVAATNIDIGMCDETASCTSSYTNSHSSQIAYAIVDDDQVNVTATVGSSITFDIDASTSDSNTGTPYNVVLGALTTAGASRSNNSTINSIWIDLDTNAVSAAITVVSANGSLKSTGTPTDTIPSTTGTMANGTANYGLCVASVTQSSGGALAKASPFNGATCVDGGSNVVGAVTTSPQNILTSPAPIAGGRSEIRVNAENSLATVAHNDYADTLTFIATGTF
jgi:hypothetical protein